MNKTTRTRLSSLLMMLGSVFILCLGGSVRADDEHASAHGAPLHGGKVVMTREYHFEAVFTRDGLRLYPRTHEDASLDASRLQGTATFFHPNSPKPWFQRKLAAFSASPSQAVSALGVNIDLSKVPANGATVEFQVAGLPEAAETTATFTVPFAIAASQEVIVARATKADEKAIAAQKVCPVSKEDLLSMGGPLKVSRGDRSTFLCCKGCLKQVQANPDKYLSH